MPTVGRKAPNENHTQSVVFEKAAGWTAENSREWVKDHDYFTDGMDENDSQIRWRQYDPDKSKFEYRTQVIKENSILLVLGILKKGASQGGEFMNAIERRFIVSEMRVDAEGMIEGYAAVFGQWSEDLGGFREKIRRGAFSKTIQESDVRALFNHDANYVLGRNKAGTLALLEDDHGLEFRAKAPDTAWANDLRVSIGRGDINQASFGFATIRDEWGNGSEKMRQRELVEVKLYDVSVVTFPAYPQTQVSARSLAEMLIARVEGEGDKGEARKMIEYLRGELAALEASDAPGLEPHPSIVESKRRLESLRR